MGGERNQKGLFAFVVLAKLALLNNQHAQQLTALNNGYAKKSAETLFLYGRNIFKTGVFLRIGKVNRFGKAANQADNTFIKGQRDRAATRLFKPPGCHQVIAATIVICQIDGTHLGVHRQANIIHQDIQRFV